MPNCTVFVLARVPANIFVLVLCMSSYLPLFYLWFIDKYLLFPHHFPGSRQLFGTAFLCVLSCCSTCSSVHEWEWWTLSSTLTLLLFSLKEEKQVWSFVSWQQRCKSRMCNMDNLLCFLSTVLRPAVAGAAVCVMERHWDVLKAQWAKRSCGAQLGSLSVQSKMGPCWVCEQNVSMGLDVSVAALLCEAGQISVTSPHLYWKGRLSSQPATAALKS